jgi:uncharacterized phiE125 gp8 family phage protein
MKNYGVLKLTVTSPAQTLTEPITLTEAKAYLRIPTYSPADTAADYLLESFIMAAREIAEAKQNRPLVAAQYDLTLDAFPSSEIELADGLATVDLFTYKDDGGTVTTLAQNTHYRVDTVRGLVFPADDTAWPTGKLWESSAITIRFTVAPPAIPKHVKAGMYMLLAHWWDQRQVMQPNAQEFREIPYGAEVCLSLGAKPRNFGC